MFRTAPRGTHRAPGRAVVDYRGLVAPVGRSMGGVAALGAVTATAAITGTGSARAEAPAAPVRPGTVTSPIPTLAALPEIATIAPSVLPTNVSLRSGARGDAVVSLQNALNAQGASIAVDGVFGPRTDRAVRSLQRSTGLTVDGIVGPRTWGALSGSPATPSRSAPPVSTSGGTPTLSIGSNGSSVVSLQNALAARGARLSGTGYFGPQTQAAVRAFQANAGLTVDGIVGPRTWGALGAAGTSVPATGGGTSAPAAPSRSDSGSAIVAIAQQQVGKPYVYGSSNPAVGFDCSGLVKYAYAQNGISVPRTANQQTFGGRIISRAEARPGDLVSFSEGNYGHIGIYAGNGMIIDASGSGGKVKYRAIWNSPHVFVTYR